MPSSPLGSLRGTVAVAALGLLLSSSSALGAASNRSLEDRANAMEARLQAVERSSKALVELQQQIERDARSFGGCAARSTRRSTSSTGCASSSATCIPTWTGGCS